MLQVTQLSCQRGDRWLWQHLEFNLSSGKLLEVIGANGCGKTSLLRILAGLAPANEGTIDWKNVSIDQQKLEYQQQLRYVGHQPAVKQELTVIENLRFAGVKISQNTLSLAIQEMGLEPYRNHFGYQLSQGQKQRVALARLLLNPAPLWILDEPFAGLDSEMIENMQMKFAQHLSQGGLIILSTHRALTSRALTDCVQRLDLK